MVVIRWLLSYCKMIYNLSQNWLFLEDFFFTYRAPARPDLPVPDRCGVSFWDIVLFPKLYAVVSVYNTNYVYVAISFQHMSKTSSLLLLRSLLRLSALASHSKPYDYSNIELLTCVSFGPAWDVHQTSKCEETTKM
jgi:hypothetical protein